MPPPLVFLYSIGKEEMVLWIQFGVRMKTHH